MSISTPLWFVFFIVLLLIGCSRTNPTTNPSGPRMNQADVIRIATEAAEREGYHLTNYEQPEASYESTTIKDKTWWVSFQGKELMPGNFFSVIVHDQTQEMRIVRGR